MNFAEIAMGVYTVLSPFVISGIGKIIDKATDEAYAEKSKIWEFAKDLFLEDEPTLLNLFKDAENDPKLQGKLEGKLETHLEANPEIAAQLEELVNKVKEIERKNSSKITNERVAGDSEISNRVNQTTGSATNNESEIENRDISNSKITNEITQN